MRTTPVPDLESVPAALRESVGFLLAKAGQHGAQLAETALRPLDLKARHYGVLVTLDACGPMSQQALGHMLAVDRTTMVAVVDHLERLGLAERSVLPVDRRTYQVRLTAAGQRVLQQAHVDVAAADAALAAQLSAAEHTHLLKLLHKLCGTTAPG